MRHYLKSLLKRCLTTSPKVTHRTKLFIELASYRLNLLVRNNEWIARSHKDKEVTKSICQHIKHVTDKVHRQLILILLHKRQARGNYRETARLHSLNLPQMTRKIGKKRDLDVIQFDYFFTPTLSPLSFTLFPATSQWRSPKPQKKNRFSHWKPKINFLFFYFSSIFLTVCHQHFSLPLGKFKLKRALIIPSFDLKNIKLSINLKANLLQVVQLTSTTDVTAQQVLNQKCSIHSPPPPIQLSPDTLFPTALKHETALSSRWIGAVNSDTIFN